MSDKKPVFIETLRILLGMTLCLAVMFGVYWALKKFSWSVLAGGLVGMIVSVGNFFFMGIGLFNLTQDAAEAQIRLRTQASFLLRTLIVLALLVVAIKLFGCDALATLLPLLFVRPVLMVEQLIIKRRGDQNRNQH